MLLLIFTLTTVSTVGSAQAGGVGISPECPPGTTLTAALLNGVPLCAGDAVCPVGNTLDSGMCVPDDSFPLCPSGTTLDFDICEAPSTCPSGTTLNPTSLLCELTIVTPAVGGTIIPIETTSLLLAGTQSTTWMIPVVLSVAGIGLFVVSRKSD